MKIIQRFKDGNQRFIENRLTNRNWPEQVQSTRSGQFPYAVVLSCIDSRVPIEIVLDQGLGDILSIRVAGNILNEDVLASMEYGCSVAGAKLILVMGHSKCGAVTSACKDIRVGNMTSLLSKIHPAVSKIKEPGSEFTDHEIEQVSQINVKHVINQISGKSDILDRMLKERKIAIIGSFYDVATGNVAFYV